jgi:hypothetical protein
MASAATAMTARYFMGFVLSRESVTTQGHDTGGGPGRAGHPNTARACGHAPEAINPPLVREKHTLLTTACEFRKAKLDKPYLRGADPAGGLKWLQHTD